VFPTRKSETDFAGLYLTDFEVPFIDRSQIIDQLTRNLTGGRRRTGALIGPAGSGKTAIALRFALLSKLAGFPAIHLHAWSPAEVNLSRLGLGDVAHPKSPILLIVDDYDENVVYDADPPWRRAAQRKDVRTLYLSRNRFARPRVDFSVVVPPLSMAEMFDLIARHLPAEQAEAVRNLLLRVVALSDGNQHSLLSTLVALQRGDIDFGSAVSAIEPVTKPGIVDTSGRPLSSTSPQYRKIIADASGVSSEFLNYLAQDPSRFHALTPRQFEEVVAELLDRQGYEVTLTPASKDGGKDIYAAKNDMLGSFLYLVECKKYDPERPVGVGIVRQLYGVAQLERATAAILATTSFFTRGAVGFQRELQFQLSLQDFYGIQRWLHAARLSDA
jgi:restriction system protein